MLPEGINFLAEALVSTEDLSFEEERTIYEVIQSEPLWPIKDRLLQGKIGFRFIKSLCDYAVGSNSILRVVDYLESEPKSQKHINSEIIDRLFHPFKLQKSNIQESKENFISLEEKKNPDLILKKKLEVLSDKALGDPRFHSPQWHTIKIAKNIALSWKTEGSINDFFQLLDYISKTDRDVKRMWPKRKEFIKKCFDKGYIHSAWFVLGREAYYNRNKFLNISSSDEYHFGRLYGGNKKHSVLLFQIDNLIFSEWSYNGKIRIWESSSESSPKMYEKEYKKEDVIFLQDKRLNPGEIAAITHDHYDKWIEKLKRAIFKYAGIDLRDIL